MALGVLREQFPGSIEMGVLANAGENIQHFAAVQLRVLHAVGRDQAASDVPRKIDQFAIDLFLAANEMPLDFNENIFAPECIDQRAD